MICETCSKPLSGLQKKFCCRKCQNKSGNFKHQNYTAQCNRGQERRIKLLKLRGGKCAHCGYCEHSAALCFHHLKDKKFGISMRECSNTNWNTLLQEAMKCIVLCMNCHTIVHTNHDGKF